MDRRIESGPLSALLLLTLAACATPYTGIDRPLEGAETIAIHIETFRGQVYDDLRVRGVTPEKLHEGISSRLRDAGFDVVDITEALDDPDAALLNLRISLALVAARVYSYGLYLKAQTKLPLGPDGSFQSETVWSDYILGGTRQSDLGDIAGSVYTLVDRFIHAHRLQN